MTVLRRTGTLPGDFVTDKPKKRARSAKAQPSVLGSLPATRPTRLARRSGAGATATEPAPSAGRTKATSARTAKAKPATAAKKRATTPPRRPTPPPPPPEPPRRAGPPTGGELVTTAVQAVGELTQIGLGAGARVLRRAARRLPRS
jgi:hypothetical protein